MEELFDRQYFDLSYLDWSKDEVFVDAGCFDGATVNENPNPPAMLGRIE